jgi:hypothetical protein
MSEEPRWLHGNLMDLVKTGMRHHQILDLCFEEEIFQQRTDKGGTRKPGTSLAASLLTRILR